jgi:hypothetical protein
MGKYILDQFSLLHFASGVIVYFWGIKLSHWIIIHILFELIENTKKGVYFIDNYLTFWPGGKKSPDTLLNSISDTIFAIFGFIIAQILDKYYRIKNME